MKKRLMSFSLSIASLALVMTVTSNVANSQGGGVKNVLWLQGTTPGTSQSGHANLSGTLTSGRVIASSSPSTGGVISASNSSSFPAAMALRGEATHASALNYGVMGLSASSSGRGVFGWANSSSGANQGVYGRSDSASGAGVYALANSSTGTNFGLYATASSPTGYAIYAEHNATSGSSSGIYSSSSIPNGHSIWGVNNSTSGTAYAVGGDTFSTSGRAIVGRANAATGTTYGVYGFNQSTSGRGVFGTATANSGTTYGVRGEVDSPDGSGVYGLSPKYGVHGVLQSTGFAPNGAGVFGFFDGLGSGFHAGVRGQTSDPDSFGVYARNEATTGGLGIGLYAYGGLALEAFGLTFGGRLSGTNYGVLGQGGRTNPTSAGTVGESSAATGSGVRGQRGAFTELGGSYLGVEGLATEGTDRGVQGDSDATTGTPYGVFGDTDGVGWAVYASGNMGASGTKSFRIDHPLDPENKYLIHYSTEAPEPMNFYSGNTVTGQDGYAWVQLPSYFDSINRDLRYQLTVIDESGEFTQAIVSKKANKNRFQIRTSRPGVEVSWRVEAVRNDAYVRHYPQPVEVDKPALERGSYEHPEIWGESPERSLYHDRPSVKRNKRATQKLLEDYPVRVSTPVKNAAPKSKR